MLFFTRRLRALGALALLLAALPAMRPALAAGPYIVTKTADTADGACNADCSLREAIAAANAAPGPIAFNIPTGDAGYQPIGSYWRIAVATPLPALSGGGIAIDGLGGDGKPKIELSGGGTTRLQGLLITSANNTVKGLIINGFIPNPQEGFGIRLYGPGTTGNTITKNYIGTNFNATAAGGDSTTNNRGGGIVLQGGASKNTIDGNIIAGNGGYGIYLYDSVFLEQPNRQLANVIKNNYIGVAADGASQLRNWNDGIYVGDNSIGTVIGPNNLISANGSPNTETSFGVNIGGYLGNNTAYITGTLVIGNKIGTNAGGTAALGNVGGGVLIRSSSGTTIGGAQGNPATPGGQGNLIAGNGGAGVWVKDTPGLGAGTTSITIVNNWIGLSGTGTAALANDGAGVLLSDSAHGVTIGPNNVIGGNGDAGVLLRAVPNSGLQPSVPDNQQTRQNTITGNKIGTDASGNAAVPNAQYGVLLEGHTFGNGIAGNTIANQSLAGIALNPDTGAPVGRPTGNTIAANTITSNGPVGIALTPGSNNNAIGLSGAGNTIAGHTSSGIEIQSSGNTLKANELRQNQIGIVVSGAPNNTIGGATVAEGNRAHDNTQHGIYITGAGATGNRVSRTTTADNGGKGIALANGGNAPIAGASLSATPPASGFSLSGTTTGCGAAGCIVQVFTSDSPPADEGPSFLTSAGPVDGAFSVDISGCQHYLIFTLTDSAGNTSEFLSPTANIPQCVPQAAAVEISTADPQPPRAVLPGATTTYSHTVTNVGTAAGPVSVSLSQSANGWASLANNTCAGQSLAPQASCSFELVVSVPANAQSGEQNVATITATIGSASAQQVDTTNVLGEPGLTFEPYPDPGSNAKSTAPGVPVSYQHTLTNTGNGVDSFSIAAAPPSGWDYSLQPATVGSLAQNQFALVTLTLTPTAGLSPGEYTAVVTATSQADPGTFAVVTDTTTITSTAAPLIVAASATPATIDPGASTVVSYTLQNAGNVSGTFSLELSTPAGWSIAEPITSSATLEPGASAVITATLQSPADAAAGAYAATLSATGDGPSASRAAIITVRQVGGLALGPSGTDPTPRAPGQVVSYTLTLENSGNFTDTVALAATASRGWPASVASPVLVGPGDTAPVTLTLSIPPGQAVLPANTTTITASSSLAGVQASAVITTELQAVAAALLTPATQTQPIIGGQPVTISLTLLNSGSLPQSYDLAAAGVPAGWQATLTPTQTQALEPGASVSVALALIAPSDLPVGQELSISVSAACRENACEPAAASVKLTTGPPVQVGGECAKQAAPGQRVTCVHTLTNSGGVTDTITLGLTSFLGWRSSLAPQVLIVGPGASATFTATLTVPTSASAYLAEKLMISVASSRFPATNQQIVDTITVKQVARLSFFAGEGRLLVPGETLTFRHSLVNTGNYGDRFTITATQAYDWNITVVPTTTATLQPGVNRLVTVTVRVPSDAPVTAKNPIVLRATSAYSPTVFAELVDLVGVARAPETILYLPVARATQ